MKKFTYRAINNNGNQIAGILEAESEHAAAACIQRRGYFVTSLKDSSGEAYFLRYLKGKRSVSRKEIAVLCRKLAIMVNAGIPLMSALRMLTEQADNAALKESLGAVYAEVEQGKTLADALKRHPKIFPSLMIHMIYAGEKGGVMGVILDRLSAHFEKDHKMREKIKTEMLYPATLLCLTFFVILFILTFVVPVFVTLFENMQMELPTPTRILLFSSIFLQDNGWWIFVMVWICGLAGAGLYHKPRCRITVDRFILHLPVFGKLMRKISTARFCRNLGTLLHNGTAIILAIDISRNMIDNFFLFEAIGGLQNKVERGVAFADALKMSGIFDPMVAQMLEVGQETGKMDLMLDKIADFYEEDVDEMVARLSTLIQPAMIVILGVVIGSIVIAVALPMFDSVAHVVG